MDVGWEIGEGLRHSIKNHCYHIWSLKHCQVWYLSTELRVIPENHLLPPKKPLDFQSKNFPVSMQLQGYMIVYFHFFQKYSSLNYFFRFHGLHECAHSWACGALCSNPMLFMCLHRSSAQVNEELGNSIQSWQQEGHILLQWKWTLETCNEEAISVRMNKASSILNDSGIFLMIEGNPPNPEPFVSYWVGSLPLHVSLVNVSSESRFEK